MTIEPIFTTQMLLDAFTEAAIQLIAIFSPVLMPLAVSAFIIFIIKTVWQHIAYSWYAFEGYSKREIRRKIKRGNDTIDLISNLSDLWSNLYKKK